MVKVAETKNLQEFLERVEIPDDLEDRLRASVYPSLRDMPGDMRREHKIAFYMGMMPKGVGWSRDDVAKIIEKQEQNPI